MFYKFKQWLLKRKYNKIRDNLYLVTLEAKYGILPCKWIGKLDKNGYPLTIHYSDCNEAQEEYWVAPCFTETTGAIIGYFFDKESAEKVACKLNQQTNICYSPPIIKTIHQNMIPLYADYFLPREDMDYISEEEIKSWLIRMISENLEPYIEIEKEKDIQIMGMRYRARLFVGDRR